MSTPSLKVAKKNPGLFVALIILGALIFATALSWNDAVKSLTQKYLGLDDSATGQVIYAAVMTVILIALAFGLAYLAPNTLKHA